METIIFLVLLTFSLFLVIRSTDFAIRYSSKLAESFHLSKYVVGFIIVAVISILPEAFISITSALDGIPSFGLGVLFGSNVADLTLVFSLVVLVSGRNLKVESKIIKNRFLYICMIFLPIILGLDGHYSKIEGLTLIIVGLLFFFYVLKDSRTEDDSKKGNFLAKDMILLIVSMAVLILGANMTVKYGVDLANNLHISPILIGMFVVGLGTTLPELFFSIKAAKKNHDGLALGDILGTVIADATILVGIAAVINPFYFEPRIIYVTGFFMLIAITLLLNFMKTGKKLTKKEAILLILFYLIFVTTELLIGFKG